MGHVRYFQSLLSQAGTPRDNAQPSLSRKINAR